MGAFGQWGNGPIQFNSNSGVIENRGTVDTPPPSSLAGPQTSSPDGILPYNGGGGGGGMGMPVADMPEIQTATGSHDESGVIPSWAGASNNGGSYGEGGGGSLGYDDGGEVPEDSEQDGVNAQQGAQASTIDPMMAIQKTLAYGRQKMGMPSNFTQGPGSQQSFDDGGEVMNDSGDSGDGSDGGVIPGGSMQSSQASSGQASSAPGGKKGMPDPRQTLMYLTGAGNVSPDIADALEKKLDPQGQMNPSTRTLHAIASAPSPDAAFGLMQHYRTRYNAYSGGAVAALDQGNLGQAAAHATQAFQNIPTGYDVRFAPARGGIAMSAKKLGRQAQPQQAMEDGGEVREFLGGEDESQNVEDRRDEAPDQNRDRMRKLSGKVSDIKSAFSDGVQSLLPKNLGGTNQLQDDMGMKSFDDGGEVEDDGNEGVIPDQTMDAPSEPETETEQDWGQPTILNPDQFKKAVTAGYDKPMDDGFSGFMNSVLGASAAVPSPVPQSRPSNLGQDNGAMGNVLGPLSRGDLSGAGDGVMNNVKSLFTKPGEAAPDVTAAVTDPADTPAGQSGPTPNQQQPSDNQRWQPTPRIMDAMRAQTSQQPGAGAAPSPPAAPAGNPAQTAQTPDERLSKRQRQIEELADRLFPSTSQAQQRSAYIGQAMQRVMDNEGRMDLEQSKGRMQMQQARDSNRMLTEQFKQQQINGRTANTTQSRENIANLNRQWNTWSKQQQDMVRVAGQQLAADPALSKDPNKLMQRVTQLAAQMGIHPQDMMTLIQNGGPPQAQGQGAPQGQPQQGGGGIQYKYYNGQVYKRGPNGEAIPVQMPQ